MQNHLLLGAASVALFGASAFAVPQDAKPQGDKPMPRTTEASATVKGDLWCHKASDVIGTNLKNSKDETVGEIEDLVIDPASGRIDYAVVSLDVKGSLKDKWYAVPFQTLEVRAMPGERKEKSRSEFTLNLDPMKFDTAPNFDKDKWPDMTAPAWRTELDKHYGVKRINDSGDVMAKTRGVRVSKLLDQNLVTTGKDKIGDIEELAIDPRNARITYVVVSSGGFLGMGDKMHAVPWGAVNATPGAGKDAPDNLVVDITKERLQKSPEFKKEEWVRMSEPTWMNELYTYYGVSPYWAGKEMGGRSGMRRDTSNPR